MLVGPIILLKVVSGTSLQFEILLRRPRCADTRNVSFSPLYGGQFTSSTQLIKPSISSNTYPSTQHLSFFPNLPPLFKSQLLCGESIRRKYSNYSIRYQNTIFISHYSAKKNTIVMEITTVPSNKAEVVIVAPDKLMLILHKILTPLPKTSNRLILLFV